MMLKSRASGSLLGNVESALAKIADALPEQASAEATRLAEIMRFFAQPGQLDFEDPRLLVIQQAIQEKRVVWIRYHSYRQEQTTQREIEPEALEYGDGAWYISAYCRLRREPRSFRLSRVEELRLQAETFLPRRMFAAPASPIEIRVRFEPGVVRWVRERQHYAFTGEEPDTQGESVIMTYRVNALRELEPWLLSWGAAAEVLAPDTLRASIATEISSLFQKYTSE
jgi:predicted DNA-binding transcriptional regulator YafY